MTDFLLTVLGVTICNGACFWLGWRLSGFANRDRTEIKYPDVQAELPDRGSVVHRSESDLIGV